MPPVSIIVVGAGIVGASTALALQQDGHQVTLLDREHPCAGASFGHAGGIINAYCTPTAMPGITIDALKMLAKPSSPLSIRPAYFLKILPWLIRFVNESRHSKVMHNARALHALSKLAVESWLQLVGDTKLNGLLESGGWLKVYESKHSFAGSLKARVLMDQIGSPYEVLNADEIRQLEPQLAPIFNYAIFQQNSLRLINPQRMVQGMVDLLVNRGGKYRQFNVESINTDSDRVNLGNSQKTISAQKVVIAAGAWSRPLARQLGDNVPLDTERGYHLMLPVESSGLLSRPVINGENSFVLSPMEMGLRLTSQVEFAGLDGEPHYQNIRSLLPAAKRMLPDLDTTEQSVWMGFRPSLPDSLPVIGYSTRSSKVLYAFGHQHLGITLGAVTARIIADMVAARDPAINLDPYKPKR